MGARRSLEIRQAGWTRRLTLDLSAPRQRHLGMPSHRRPTPGAVRQIGGPIRSELTSRCTITESASAAVARRGRPGCAPKGHLTDLDNGADV